jgi:Spy/CpxP family protein refolding chaperone
MKLNELMAVLAGTIVLTGLAGVGFAAAQTLNNVRQSLISTSNTELAMNELTPAEEAQQWQEEKQRYKNVGIHLTPQQETIIRQAHRQFAIEMRQVFQNNPLMTIAQLIAASSLPQVQGEDMIKATRLDKRLGEPVQAYRNSVLNALTPEQRQIWEERIWQGGNQTQSSDSQITFDAPNPIEQAQQWEATKQRFRDAGVPLTPQQEAQMQAANAKLQADLNQEFQANPTGTFARFMAVAMLPASITERFAEGLLGQAVITHWDTIDQILTPEQRQVWQQGFGNLR